MIRRLFLVVLLLLAGCSDGGSEPTAIRLDGSPRIPDAEGVVVSAGRAGIELDGDRSYEVSDDLVSISTYTMQTLPVAHTVGRYVHLGLDGDVVVWIASIGTVVTVPEKHVIYTGTLTDTRPGRLAVFQDGTVLRVAEGVTTPVKKGFVRAFIDPDRREVRRLEAP